MPRSSCEPCCNPSELARIDSSWRDGVLQVLCAIAGFSGGASAQFITDTQAGAAGGVPTAGALFFANSNPGKILNIGNTTDVPVLISVDGGTTYPYFVPATTGALTINAAQNGLVFDENVWMKAVGSNSSSGTLYGSLSY